MTAKLSEILRSSGLKTASQKYEYKAAGGKYAGENVYGIIHAPRGDATEAIVLVAAWTNMDGELNQSGVALALTLARYFKCGSSSLGSEYISGRESNTAQGGHYGPKILLC